MWENAYLSIKNPKASRALKQVLWENAYLSIKNPKASRALKQVLDPGHTLLASLHRQLLGPEVGAASLTKSWIRTCTA